MKIRKTLFEKILFASREYQKIIFISKAKKLMDLNNQHDTKKEGK